MWSTRLLDFFDGSSQVPTPPGDQSIVLISENAGLSNCPSHPSFILTHIFVTLSDLSGPDVRVDRGVAYGLAHSFPVLYNGRTLFIDNELGYVDRSTVEDGSGITLYEYAKGSGVHFPVCWFAYRGNDKKSGE
jgi:hypothetical protein